MFQWMSSVLDRICAVIGAIILMQLPMFIDQYSLRLSGHVEELNYQVNKMEYYASLSKKTLEQYIRKFILSKDADFSAQGKIMEEMRVREKKLTDSLLSLKQGNLLTRPFIFLFQSDWAIVDSTFQFYQMGISFSFESIIYAIIGVLLGYYLYRALSAFFVRVYRGLIRAKRKDEIDSSSESKL